MTNTEKLKSIIDEIDVLIAQNTTNSTPEFQAWHMKAKRFLEGKFGNSSSECRDFKKTYFCSLVIGSGNEIECCKRDLIKTKAIFKTYYDEMLDEADTTTIDNNISSRLSDKIFIVHGHDEGLKQTVARIIEKQNIDAIILSEQTNQGQTIIEKLENHSDVGCAICLFTPDDTGKAKKETDYKARARQNVVLEAGFFMGKLGRDHVVFIASDDIDMPSDLQGVVYTNTNNWQIDLLKELKAIGYTIDFNKFYN